MEVRSHTSHPPTSHPPTSAAHAPQLGEQQQWTKHQSYETSLRIPFILRPPAHLRHRVGTVVRAPTEALLGLLPTLLELTGVDPAKIGVRLPALEVCAAWGMGYRVWGHRKQLDTCLCAA